jgi:hypothetical protein
VPIPKGAKVRSKGKGAKRVLLIIQHGKVTGVEKPKSEGGSGKIHKVGGRKRTRR